MCKKLLKMLLKYSNLYSKNFWFSKIYFYDKVLLFKNKLILKVIIAC